MSVKKKNDRPLPLQSLPPGFRRLEIAIPDEAWDVYSRYAKQIGCAPGDVVTSILGVGFERLRIFEMVAEKDKQTNATRH